MSDYIDICFIVPTSNYIERFLSPPIRPWTVSHRHFSKEPWNVWRQTWDESLITEIIDSTTAKQLIFNLLASICQLLDFGSVLNEKIGFDICTIAKRKSPTAPGLIYQKNTEITRWTSSLVIIVIMITIKCNPPLICEDKDIWLGIG